MSTDNTSLEEMVEKVLETTGVLPKMKAELRANVFHVLEKGSSFQNKLYTDKIKDFISDNNGLLLLSLVKDLFEYLGLTYTTSVFDPETGAGLHYQYKEKNDIFQELSLCQDGKKPLLLQILESFKSFSKNELSDSSVKSSTQIKSPTYGTLSSQILQNNEKITKTLFDNKSKSLSPIKTSEFESNALSENHSNPESLSSSNYDISDIVQFKVVDNSENVNSSSIEQLSPIKRPVEQNDKTDEDVKSDIRSNKEDESSLDDIETDENVSCGNDSLPSTDLSTQNSSPENMIKTRNIHLL